MPEDGYLLDNSDRNMLWSFRLVIGALARMSCYISCLLWESPCFGVIIIVIALAFTGEIHALPSSFTQEAGTRGWKAELSPATFPEDVNIVSSAEDNNVALPSRELLTLIGSGRLGDRLPVHLLHLGIAYTGSREEHSRFYSVMRPAVATAHPGSLCGAGIVQYLHAGIHVNAFGDSLASVGNADIGTQRLTWVNNDSRVRLFRLINKINSDPRSFVGLGSVKLAFVHSPSKESQNNQKRIYDYLSGVIGAKETEITQVFGYLWLALGVVLLCLAQLVPLRQYRLRKKLLAGLAFGFGLLVLGLYCVNQFYDLVFLR